MDKSSHTHKKGYRARAPPVSVGSADLMLPRLQPGVALARMRPYTAALCIVRRHDRIGFAYSDPYLSSATPLATADADASKSELQNLLEEMPPVGLLVLGSAPALDPSSHESRSLLPESIEAMGGALTLTGMSCCEWECDLTLDELKHHCATSDHWEQIDTELRESEPPHQNGISRCNKGPTSKRAPRVCSCHIKQPLLPCSTCWTRRWAAG